MVIRVIHPYRMDDSHPPSRSPLIEAHGTLWRAMQHDLAEARGQLARELFQAPEISAIRAVLALGGAPVSGLS